MPTRNALRFLLALAILALGCGSSTSSPGTDAGGGDAKTGKGGNVVPLVVNAGPPGTESVDVPFVEVTLCVPGTSTCQTVDSVSVDTGSSGTRILSSALAKGFDLPLETTSGGDPLAECYTFADGYIWGSVRLADLKIGGEVAAKIPIQVVGDPMFGSVPRDCASTGSPEDTLVSFGSKGLIGVNQLVPDCGPECANHVIPAAYYACPGGSCKGVAVPVAQQVPNPVGSFGADANGVSLEFPSVASAGALTLEGKMTFGIGTQSNNGLGDAKVLTVDDFGNFTTVYKGKTFGTSFLDSGTNELSFNDKTLAPCPEADLQGYFCPSAVTNLTAENVGRNQVTTEVTFSVASAKTLFENPTFAAFDDLAGSGIDNSSFDWGFPFFIGRTVFVAFDGANTPGGSGPYFAY